MQHRVSDFMTLVVAAYKKLQQIKKKQTALYAAYDIKSQHVMVLFFLGHHSAGLTVTELASLCCEDKSATSRAVEYLVERGYAVHEEDMAKRRWRSKVRITPAGMRLCRIIDHVSIEASNIVKEGISDDDLQVFYRVFHQMVKNMDRML
jgi:DNA-binding MarR family transcriptional regulator